MCKSVSSLSHFQGHTQRLEWSALVFHDVIPPNDPTIPHMLWHPPSDMFFSGRTLHPWSGPITLWWRRWRRRWRWRGSPRVGTMLRVEISQCCLDASNATFGRKKFHRFWSMPCGYLVSDLRLHFGSLRSVWASIGKLFNKRSRSSWQVHHYEMSSQAFWTSTIPTCPGLGEIWDRVWAIPELVSGKTCRKP